MCMEEYTHILTIHMLSIVEFEIDKQYRITDKRQARQ